jgi:N-acetylmuramoyl-L-alanine amidase
LERVKLFCALTLPALLLTAEPEPVLFRAKLPTGDYAILRLQFKKGLSVEGKSLPKGFLAKGALPVGWIGFAELSTDGKRWALATVFPDDEWRAAEVRHTVRYPELESVWLISTFYTGHGQNYDKLMAENPRLPEKLREGDVWRIPSSLLASEFGGQGKAPDRSQPEDELEEDERVAANRAMLSFDEDRQGKFAAYHMRKGEALYTGVVMRYTDRVDPKDVNDLALEIAKRSGIADVRGIQPGQLVKIPLTYLSDPFLPEGSKGLAEEQEIREEVRRTTRVEAGPRLKGVRIILDPGHGGIDIGARSNGVWESDHVYDITMRVRRLLEQETDASVSSTLRIPGLGFKSRESIRSATREAEILTNPTFANDGESPSAVSVHLRWVLANDWFNAFRKKKGDAQKTLFISFHADSLHPSARGTMVYVPASTLVPSVFALSANRGAGVSEMKRASRVSFSGKEKVQGEARSRQFAEGLLRSLTKAHIPVHGDRAIRNVIHRDGKKFVPAVIRYSNANTKVLIEIANLTNELDSENLRDPDFRERYAVAVVNAIRAYYRK